MTITEPEVLDRLMPLLHEAETRSVIVSNGHEDLGAIVSMKDYEIIRRAKVDDFMQALDRLGQDIRKNAAAQGISIDELEKMLDRKAPCE